ncbi:MAG TPA: alpha/beta hydrolase, partial [Saprospiraceae bacterium]|nr:alpha/beta hydrolase [Saprospiraceae bacterium]
GLYVTVIFGLYVYRVTRAPDVVSDFEHAFGRRWENRIDATLKTHFLPRRSILRLPAVSEPKLEQNIVFATIPGTGRDLLCDVWQPSTQVPRSGLAFIYMHGSAFYFLDKDFGTRPFFKYLAAQGHVIMDVAYRLFPETNMMGMVQDVKRAIAWMRENAEQYGIDPDQIVLGGGSAGAHLALQAAYTADDTLFTPIELKGKDLSVNSVISLYGTNDVEAIYYHTNQHLTTRSIPGQPKKAVPTQMPAWLIKSMGADYVRLGFNKSMENVGTLAPMMGGHPDECPAAYALFSPVKHVHANCPPTLLIHGAHDIMAPVRTTKILFSLLKEKNVPVVMHILPQTDHGFDLLFPQIAPTAHTTYYDVERFLALQIKKADARTPEPHKAAAYELPLSS